MSMPENQNQENAVNGNATNGEAANTTTTKENSKGNEDRKIFVGGIAYDVTNDDLVAHFQPFGEVSNAQVKFDRNTGRSRGFAFVEFGTAEACKLALNQREQTIKGKQVEVKPAKSRENKKVFVGGLPADFPEEDLRRHFEQYGKVEDIEWPYDKATRTRRNFAFIVFEEDEGADQAAATPRQTFGSRECDVKKAVPQSKRFGAMPRGMAMRAGYTNGMRGGAMVQNPAQWFGGNWGQMGGMPYPNSPAWGDWYNNAGFYAQGSAGPTTDPNGYDYSQGQPGSRTQPAAMAGGQAANARYPQQY